MTRFLKLSSCGLVALLMAACSSSYKALEKMHCPVTMGSNPCSLPDTRPRFEKAYYRCYINGGFLFKNYHLSGILLLKHLNEGNRALFANEMGYVFFDFGWYSSGSTGSRVVYDSFVVHNIMPKLNRSGLIRTLRKDIELALGDVNNQARYNKGDTAYYKAKVGAGGYAWMVFSPDQELKRIEVAGKRSAVTTIYKHPRSLADERNMFDSLKVIHHRAHFTIEAYRFTPSNSDSNAE